MQEGGVMPGQANLEIGQGVRPHWLLPNGRVSASKTGDLFGLGRGLVRSGRDEKGEQGHQVARR